MQGELSRAGRHLGALVAAGAALAACAGAPRHADMVLHNGVVYTANADYDVHEAVVVEGDRILAVGGEEIVSRYSADTVIDLQGRLLIPGFNDAHTHISARGRGFVELSDATSIADIQQLVAAAAEELEPGRWVTGYGWSEDRLAENRKPNRADLDAAAPDHPVVLTREGSHSAVANSLALEIAGLDADSPQPEGGELEKDAAGELTGVIAERFDLVSRHVTSSEPQELAEDLARQLRAQFAFGITSLTNATTGPGGYDGLWTEVYAQADAPLPRATVQINPGLSAGGGAAAAERLAAFGRITGDGDDRLKVGALKVFVDGGFTGPAAWTRRPYRNDPDYYGSLASPLEDIEALSRAAHEMGWQLGYHAIGDAAIEETVALFAEILAESPREDHRHYLNHFTVMPSAETMEIMGREGVAITQQPNFTYSLEGRYREYLPDAALASNNPIATPVGHGVFVAFSSDIIPIGPLVGVYAAVTRRGASGEVYAPEEAVSIEDALRRYTYGGAFVNFDEDVKGVIAPGLYADFAVLSENLLDAPPERILETSVDMTILGGEIVYERASR